MRRIILLAFLLVGISVHAQTLTLERGDVIAQIGYCTALPEDPCLPDELFVADSFGIPKPGAAPGLPQFFEPYGMFFFDSNHALYSTGKDGRRALFEWHPALYGSTSLFLEFGAAGEMLRMRNGDLLIAADIDRPYVVRVTPAGDTRGIYAIDPPLEKEYGLAHMELLADQCTLLWTPSRSAHGQVHTFDICTGKAKPDFLDATSQFESDIAWIGSIRALPNGDVLIATWKDVRRFDRAGKKVATYQAPQPLSGRRYLALTPDASGVWISGYQLVHRIDFASPSSPAVTFITKDRTYLFRLSVIGEWRAAEQPPPVPKRRSVR